MKETVNAPGGAQIIRCIVGGVGGLAVASLILMLFSWLILCSAVPVGLSGVAAGAALAVGSFAGSFFAVGMKGPKPLLFSLCSAAVLLLLLFLVRQLAFAEPSGDVLANSLCVAAGGLCAGLVSALFRGRKKNDAGNLFRKIRS